MALIARGRGKLYNFSPAQDCLETMAAVRKMGLNCLHEDSYVSVCGISNSEIWSQPNLIDAGNSGTTARLFMGMAGFLEAGGSITIHGDTSLSRRPMERVAKYLRPMGIDIEYLGQPGVLPLSVKRTGPVAGICQVIEEPSAQVKSAVLIAGLAAQGVTEITQTAVTRNHTELILEAMGAKIIHADSNIRMSGGPLTFPLTWRVPGDISSAAWWAAMAAVSGQVTLQGVGINKTRLGFIDVLQAMGTKVSLTQLPDSMGEPVADLEISQGELHGIELDPCMIPSCIDELPALAVVAAFAQGRTVVRGAGELRLKESDRILEIARMLSSFGAQCKIFPDGFSVQGGKALRAGQFHSSDHRMVMAAAIMAALTPGTSVVSDLCCLDISYPGFLRDLDRLTGRLSG